MEKKDASLSSGAQASSDLLLETAGRMVAVEFALKVLISTHPAPEQLAALWREHAPLLIDAGLENPLYQANASFRNGLNSQLERLAAFLKG